jgi:hypothetical protein
MRGARPVGAEYSAVAGKTGVSQRDPERVGAEYSILDVDQGFREAIPNDQGLLLGLLVGRGHRLRRPRRKCVATDQTATTEYSAPTAQGSAVVLPGQLTSQFRALTREQSGPTDAPATKASETQAVAAVEWSHA